MFYDFSPIKVAIVGKTRKETRHPPRLSKHLQLLSEDRAGISPVCQARKALVT
jgi:hypothetical protein